MPYRLYKSAPATSDVGVAEMRMADDARKKTSWLYQGGKVASETNQDRTLILQKSPSFSTVFGEGACAGWQESLSKLILLWFCPYDYYPYSLLFIISSLLVVFGT